MVGVEGRMKRPIFMYKRVLLSDPEIKLLSEILRQNLVGKSDESYKKLFIKFLIFRIT